MAPEARAGLNRHPNVLSVPLGLPFLPTLVDAIRAGRFHSTPPGDDPLALASTTIFVPTRRAARALRSLFVERGGGQAAILPTIRPLGEFEEDRILFEPGEPAALELAPPIAGVDRLLRLAPLIRLWIGRLPAHLASLYGEDVVVPSSSADALWLARDLAELMDEVETEGADWARLKDLVPEQLANWWQVTLTFLAIVSTEWPNMLAELERTNPAAHRSAILLAEAERLARNPPPGPVIAAGSTGSIPATAALLAVIARLPGGAVVLPGLDKRLDDRAWEAIGQGSAAPSVYGHPQFGLRKLTVSLGVVRADVDELGAPDPALALRADVLAQALRPAETTDDWAAARARFGEAGLDDAFRDVALLDAANEREEALAIAIALREAVDEPGRTAALVTGDRTLARRVATELRRFNILADDSGGTPLRQTPPATLLLGAVRAVFTPGDPVAILSLLKHPLLHLGLPRSLVRHAAEQVELAALRGGTGRPDVTDLRALFADSLAKKRNAQWKSFWLPRIADRDEQRVAQVLDALHLALEPLKSLAEAGRVSTEHAALLSVQALEGLGRGEEGDLSALYAGDAGAALADFLRGLVGSQAGYDFASAEWPAVLDALVASEAVKPTIAGDGRVSIWGALEARLQTVDTLVVGALNEGTWPRRTEPDRFLSRGMKHGLSLEPPERRIGQAAHDFAMAMGNRRVILTRSARSGGAPAVPSRWWQRLTTFLGPEQEKHLRARGDRYLRWAVQLDERDDEKLAARPEPKPPVAVRPRDFSVTEIETLRRDPYAIYARRILKLEPLEPLLRDPGAADRGNLFHEILDRFTREEHDPRGPDALDHLLRIGRDCFDQLALPPDVEAVWWPRFALLAADFIRWDAERWTDLGAKPRPELKAQKTAIGATKATLRGRADRIDLLPGGLADILDYKTGSGPSKRQAHHLVSPQLALEAALLKRGAFDGLDKLEPADLLYVRLKPNGTVTSESILELKGAHASCRSAPELAEDAWARLEALIRHYDQPEAGYRSRALPFREHATDGVYDHLARVLEWSAGAESPEGGEGTET